MKRKFLRYFSLSTLLVFVYLKSTAQCFKCTDALPINNGLVFCLPFNGNTLDESGNGYNGTVNGASLIADRFGNINAAYHFNGTGDYIDLAKNLPDLPTLTLSMWINATGNASSLGFIVFEGDNNCSNDFFVYYSAGKLHFAANKNSKEMDGSTNAGEVAFAINGWAHIVWTMTSTQSKIYINGALVSIFNKTASQVGYHHTPSIGSLSDGDGGACGQPRAHFFSGNLDDIRLYNRALSASEILNLSSADSTCCESCINTTPCNAGLVLCLPFDGNAIDGTGNGYNGTVSGATLTTDRYGIANKAYKFNGTSDYIDLVKNLPDLTILTLSMWVRPTGNSSTLGFIIFEGDQDCGNDFFVYYKDGYLHFASNKNSTELDGTTNVGEVAYSQTGWAHVAWTMTSTQSLVYINGVLKGTFNKTASQTGHHHTPSIGSLFDGDGGACGQPRNHFYAGDLDDIRLYNRVLSASEVTTLYNRRPLTGLDESRFTNGAVIYPNPAKNSINIQLPSNILPQALIEFYEISGKKIISILNPAIQGNELIIENLNIEKGIYFISITNGNATYKNKIVIE